VELEALDQVGMAALAADREVFLHGFGHFFLTARVPSPGALALHPDPQSPRLDGLFGPPMEVREDAGS
jgi:hypothetical protein